MDTPQLTAKALPDLDRVDRTAGLNDAAYRKQSRSILSSPVVRCAIARARDAPKPQEEVAMPPKPAKKRTTKPKPTPGSINCRLATAGRFFYAQSAIRSDIGKRRGSAPVKSVWRRKERL